MGTISGQAVNPIALAAIPINSDNGTRTIVNNKISVSFQQYMSEQSG